MRSGTRDGLFDRAAKLAAIPAGESPANRGGPATVVIRAAERWRSIKYTEFERRQIAAIKKELDQEYEAPDRPCCKAVKGCHPKPNIQQLPDLTIWMRWRCAAGICQRSAVCNSRIWRLVHLTIRPPPNQMITANHTALHDQQQSGTVIRRFNHLWKRYKFMRIQRLPVQIELA